MIYTSALSIVALGFLLVGTGCSGSSEPAQLQAPAEEKQAAGPGISGVRNDNIKQIFLSISADNFGGQGDSKSEFETTAQYEARMATVADTYKNKYGDLEFVFTPDVEYNADTEEMNVHLLPSMGSVSGKIEYGYSTLKIHKLDRARYGVPSSVEVLDLQSEYPKVDGVRAISSYGISIDAKSPLIKQKGNSDRLHFKLHISAEAARDSKEFLRGVINGHLLGGATAVMSKTSLPSEEYPFELLSVASFVPFYLERLRIVDSRTGAVLGTFPK